MEDTCGKILMVLGTILLIAVTLVISVILGGWAVSTLWAWFIVPVFAVSQLGIVQAMGISALVTYMTYHGAANKCKCNDEDKSPWEAIVTGIFTALITPVMFVFIGWIITFFL